MEHILLNKVLSQDKNKRRENIEKLHENNKFK